MVTLEESSLPKPTTRQLDCPLSETEIRERGESMASAERTIDRVKVERRKLNAQIREQTDLMSQLATAIENRCEVRDVVCNWKGNYKTKRWALVRTDTNVVIEERDMTELDLQTRLDLGDDDGEAPAKPRKTKKKASKASKRSNGAAARA